MPVSEFDIIEQVFRAKATAGNNVVCGIGDDAAIVEVPTGQQLVISTDTLVSGVHFFPDADPFDIGYRSLAVNLSDMAAMAAGPAWMTLALTLPDNNIDWLHRYADGLFSLANRHNVALVGGNIAQGPLSITITIMGTVPTGQAVLRSTAQAGDLIYVTGQLGMAALALAISSGELAWTGPIPQPCLDRFIRPEPRVQAGLAIRGLASACIDISDGLAADLGHLLQASGRGARIQLSAIPVYESLQLLDRQQIWKYALCRGDDYELCFTVPPHHRQALEQRISQAGCPLTHIGIVTLDPQPGWIDTDGNHVELTGTGYRHF